MADEEECCPLCMEELDLTDKTFNACPCGYQVCLWCWHQIKNEYNALCPACRAPYSELSKQKSPLDREDVMRRTKQRKQKEKSERRTASQTRIPTINRKNLANVRVMQRNLVYVIGLPQHFAEDEILRSNECFGQYGKIVKAVVNKSHLNSDRANATASAYITFANKDDALSCIIAIDGYYLDGSVLRASFGTTKYCNFFLRSLQCNNPDCLYLHELGEQDDSFTKEEMQSALHSGKAAFRDLSGQSEIRSGSRFPPPPRSENSDSQQQTPPSSATSAAAAASSPSRPPVTPASASGSPPPGVAAVAAAPADAQRKAQSAAAIHKLRQTNGSSSEPRPARTELKRHDSYSRIVSGNATSSSLHSHAAAAAPVPPPPPPAAAVASPTTRSTQPTPLETRTQDDELTSRPNTDRRPSLRVDTATTEDTSSVEEVVGPLEALKLGLTSQEPAWAQPFPRSTVTRQHQQSDDGASPPPPAIDTVFSPFGLGFDGGIRSGASPQSGTNSAWGTVASTETSSMGRINGDLPHHSHSSDLPPLSQSAAFAQHGASSTNTSAPRSGLGGNLSFASIDAIFSERSESSEALAGLLGVELSSTPLAHGSSPSMAKSARSSRFAFANDERPGTGMSTPSSSSSLSPPPPPSSLSSAPHLMGSGGRYNGLGSEAHGHGHGSFGYNGFPSPSSGASSLPSAQGMFPPTASDTSAFPPLGGFHGSHGGMGGPFGEVPSHRDAFGASSSSFDSAPPASGLAFLQQMLPNVNISFGGEYATTGGEENSGLGLGSGMNHSGMGMGMGMGMSMGMDTSMGMSMSMMGPSHTSSLASAPTNNANAWADRRGSGGLGLDAMHGSSMSSPPGYFDPAIVAAPGLGGFYGGNGRDGERRLESPFQGGYRHSGAVMDN